MRTKKYLLSPGAFFCTALLCGSVCLTGCEKEHHDETPDNRLAGTIWAPATADPNPSTNPPENAASGETNRYYPWAECLLDDSFSFKDNGVLQWDTGTDECGENQSPEFFGNGDISYRYDEELETLSINGISLTVAEITADRLKVYLPVPDAGGYSNLIFVFGKR